MAFFFFFFPTRALSFGYHRTCSWKQAYHALRRRLGVSGSCFVRCAMNLCRKCLLGFPFPGLNYILPMWVPMRVHRYEHATTNPFLFTFIYLTNTLESYFPAWDFSGSWAKMKIIMIFSLMDLLFLPGDRYLSNDSINFYQSISANCKKHFEGMPHSTVNLRRKMTGSKKRWSNQ